MLLVEKYDNTTFYVIIRALKNALKYRKRFNYVTRATSSKRFSCLHLHHQQ